MKQHTEKMKMSKGERGYNKRDRNVRGKYISLCNPYEKNAAVARPVRISLRSLAREKKKKKKNEK